MYRITLLGLCVIVPGNDLCAQEPASRASQVWTLRTIDLDVQVDTGRRIISGSGILTVDRPRNAPDALVLNLGATGVFTNASANGATSTIDSNSRSIRLSWDSSAAPGGSIAVRVAFEHRIRGFQIVVDPAGALASWVTGWYPSPEGRPSRARGVIRYQLPRGWQVLSNGAPRRGVSLSDTTVTWDSADPVNWSFAAAAYQVDSVAIAGGGVARVYTLRDGSKGMIAREYVQRTSEVLTALRPVFGRYPYPAYAIAEVPDQLVTWGGSSEQGFFLAPGSALGTRVNLPLLAHELAHGWWGNAAQPAGPATLMLTEALSQLGAAIAIEAIEGRDAARDFLRFSRDGYNSRQSARGFFSLRTLGFDKPLAQLDGTGQDHNLSNAKGHWFYLMLRDRLGPDRFAALLQELIATHLETRLTLATLREAAETASPDRPRMRRFLEDWLDHSGAPQVDLSWRQVSAREIELVVRQRGRVYDLDVPVRVSFAHGTVTHMIQSDSSRVVRRFSVTGLPLAVELDPEYRLLRWDPDYGPAAP